MQRTLSARIVAAWLALGVSVYAGGASARPLDTVDAAGPDVGSMELELGAGYGLRGEGGEGALPVGLAWGVARGWELSLAGGVLTRPHGNPDGASLRSDVIALGAKRIVRSGSLQGGSGPSVAVETALELDPMSTRPGGALVMALSHALGPVTSHVNLGGAYTTGGEVEVGGSLALEGPGVGPLAPVGEIGLGWVPRASVSPWGLLGVVLEADPRVAFDLGATFTRGEGRAAVGARVGLTAVLD